MTTRTGAAWRWASWQSKTRTLTSAFCAAAAAAAVVMAMPAALADPAQDPGNPLPAPVVDPPPLDPMAAPAPPGPALGPAVAPVAAPTPPVDPNAPPAAQPVGPNAPPAAQPVDPNAPTAAQSVTGPVAGQDPTPFTGDPPFRPPTIDPANGATVGVAKPIVIKFAVPISDHGLAEQAIHISSNPPVPGKFYWLNDSQVRWRPLGFWPAHTTVHIDAAGMQSNFTIGDSLIGNIDDSTHQMTVTRNSAVIKTIPVSIGIIGPKTTTPNGTYYVSEKYPSIVMDSSTFGIPVDSPMGYRVTVNDAVRLSNTGIFVHSAPWSIADQGKRDVSHGCINISPDNAKWFMSTFNSGDPVIVTNSQGIYNQNDGYDDWQR
jgi:lipoprotein-anchoring transpeptidase ErfK/SrfK